MKIYLIGCSKTEWLVDLLDFLDVSYPKHISISCDNQSAIHLAQNSVFYERTKRIEMVVTLFVTRLKNVSADEYFN